MSQFIEMFGNPLSLNQKNELKRLGECCILNPRRPNIALCDTDKVSFIPMPAVSEDGYLVDMTDEEYGKVKKGFTYFENNDVLFAKITPCMENGKGAIVHGLTNGIGMGSTEFHVLRPINGISSPYWLLALTRMPIFRERAVRESILSDLLDISRDGHFTDTGICKSRLVDGGQRIGERQSHTSIQRRIERLFPDALELCREMDDIQASADCKSTLRYLSDAVIQVYFFQITAIVEHALSQLGRAFDSHFFQAFRSRKCPVAKLSDRRRNGDLRDGFAVKDAAGDGRNGVISQLLREGHALGQSAFFLVIADNRAGGSACGADHPENARCWVSQRHRLAGQRVRLRRRNGVRVRCRRHRHFSL